MSGAVAKVSVGGDGPTIGMLTGGIRNKQVRSDKYRTLKAQKKVCFCFA
jgi:hypothetical protein